MNQHSHHRLAMQNDAAVDDAVALRLEMLAERARGRLDEPATGLTPAVWAGRAADDARRRLDEAARDLGVAAHELGQCAADLRARAHARRTAAALLPAADVEAVSP